VLRGWMNYFTIERSGRMNRRVCSTTTRFDAHREIITLTRSEQETVPFDVAGTGNVAQSRYFDTQNTNFDLNRRASPRPCLWCGSG
jgi:hypothetical protein